MAAVGEEVLHGRASGVRCEPATEGLGAGDDLVVRAEDYGVASVLDEDIAAMGEAVLLSKVGGELSRPSGITLLSWRASTKCHEENITPH